MLQLISSQLDMDRMDYLKRDSFYSGVAEGNVNSERLIQMMNVVDDVLVIEEKDLFCRKISNVQTINVLASLFA
jgi:HD superfamily phosphohydrolase